MRLISLSIDPSIVFESIQLLGATGTESEVVKWTLIVLKVAFALGFVIFVHELGHFLVARACGVKCEKFMIGFDIGGYKLSRKWGETEYGIGIVPLGGYVKMLGQDDDPGQIAEQIQKSRVDVASGDGVEVTGPNGEKYLVDRRSYLAKSVPQRMAIISAGVIMNVIFAFIFAVIAYGLGVPYVPSIVSESTPGSPAWEAGIEPGDEILQIGNRIRPTFNQLRGGVMLGDHDNGIPTVVRRAATGEEEAIVLKPERNEGKLARIGVVPPWSLNLSKQLPTRPGTPSAEATLQGEVTGDIAPKLSGGDTITRINGVEISNFRQLSEQLAKHASDTIEITVNRAEQSGESARAGAGHAPSKELTFQIPPRPMGTLGLVLAMGPITSIQPDSPAAKAGLKVGDIIETVDGEALDGTSGWDPATLPEKFSAVGGSGESIALTVRRPAVSEEGSASEKFESIELEVTPEAPRTFHSMLAPGMPMGIPALGLAYQIENRVVSVIPGGPAATSGIAPGDRIAAVTLHFPETTEGNKPEPQTVKLIADRPGLVASIVGKLFGQDTVGDELADLPNWPAVLTLVQHFRPGTSVELAIANEDGLAGENAEIVPATREGIYVADRGLLLEPVMQIRKASSFGEQLELGWEETVDALLMVYRFLQKIGTQVPLTALGGPVTIAKAAGYSAAEGMSSLLIFLTMLSANLAVINFLPIPVLDGGHMVFLAYEGLRGRPANEKVVGIMHLAGFALIVSLMLFVLALDLEFIPRNL